jgi:hypothetical protein
VLGKNYSTVVNFFYAAPFKSLLIAPPWTQECFLAIALRAAQIDCGLSQSPMLAAKAHVY